MGNDYPDVGAILDNFIPILSLFVVGYFVLFVVYDEIFLRYDIITRVVLAVVASLVLPVSSIIGDKLAVGHGKPIQKSLVVTGSKAILILTLFSIIELFDLDSYLKENPLYYLIVIVIITIYSFFIRRAYQKGVKQGRFNSS